MSPPKSPDRGLRLPLRGQHRQRGERALGGGLCPHPAGHVVHAQEQLFSCATNSAMEITDMIKEKGLNRVVVAACSPRTLEPLFRDTLLGSGHQPILLRDGQHPRAQLLGPLQGKGSGHREGQGHRAHVRGPGRAFGAAARSSILPVNKAALVVGGGIAGMTCALSIAAQGHPVHLVERETELGGNARNIHYTLEGMDVQAYPKDLVKKVYKHPGHPCLPQRHHKGGGPVTWAAS